MVIDRKQRLRPPRPKWKILKETVHQSLASLLFCKLGVSFFNVEWIVRKINNRMFFNISKQNTIKEWENTPWQVPRAVLPHCISSIL